MRFTVGEGRTVVSSVGRPMSSSRPPSPAPERTRPHTVLVVDDSAFMRRVISDILASTRRVPGGGHRARRQRRAAKVHQLEPDLVTMDVEMPGLDGLSALGYIMSETPRPVVMLSAYTAEGGDATMRALDYGAVDFVAKPSGHHLAEPGDGGRPAAGGAARRGHGQPVGHAGAPRRPRGARPAAHRAPPGAAAHAPEVVVAIAASTGGPRALAELLPRLRASISHVATDRDVVDRDAGVLAKQVLVLVRSATAGCSRSPRAEDSSLRGRILLVAGEERSSRRLTCGGRDLKPDGRSSFAVSSISA